MALNKNAFKLMREEFEKYDEYREELIKISRKILQNSKKSIYSIHRNDLIEAKNLLDEAQKLIKQTEVIIKKDNHLAGVGAYSEALEEYVEASCYYNYVKNNKLSTNKDLNVDAEVYIPGLCDLVGELVRKAINASIKGDYKTALDIRSFVEEIYEELMMFDFKNSPTRKKFDSIKYGLEKLEDLALKIKFKK